MQHHFQLTDKAFEQQFKDCTLDPTMFTHEAHIRLAWIHIKKYGVFKACENICEQIQKFDKVFDKGVKFNKTVTIASIKAVHHFMSKSSLDNFREFIQEHPKLNTNLKELLAFHYAYDIYNSDEAKIRYVEPDLLPF